MEILLDCLSLHEILRDARGANFYEGGYEAFHIFINEVSHISVLSMRAGWGTGYNRELEPRNIGDSKNVI